LAACVVLLGVHVFWLAQYSFSKAAQAEWEEQEWYKEQASKPEVKEDSFNPIVVSKKTFLFPHCRNNMNG